MRYLHKEPHGLTFEVRDALARARGLLTLGSLPNQDGYQFYGVAIDGWVFKCHIHKGQDGIHRVAGEATFHQLIGWRQKR